MTPARHLLLSIVLLAVATTAGCTSRGSAAQATAEAFLDAHYVHIDLEAGRALCAGLALEKVEKEIALTRDTPIGEDTRRPRVSYSMREASESAGRAQYAYDLEIRPGGADVFHKLVVLSLREDTDGWRVTNFSESDRASG